MDPNVAAAIIAPLVALSGVLATVTFAALRRNGNGQQQQQRGNEVMEMFRQSTVSLTQLASNQGQIVTAQSEIVRGQDRIVNEIHALVESHIRMEGPLKVLDDLVEERRAASG